MSTEETLQTAVSIIEMEGFHIDEQSKKWCRMLYNNQLTIEEYIGLVKAKAGVNG